MRDHERPERRRSPRHQLEPRLTGAGRHSPLGRVWAIGGGPALWGVLVWALATCAHSPSGTGVPFRWRASGKSIAAHAEVVTANRGYQRDKSQVLVRKIARPTRANLDFAAYHANFMNADPAPENAARLSGGGPPDIRNPFDGALQVDSLTGTFAGLPLSQAERAHPLAMAPLIELLTSKHVPGGEALEDVAAKVRAEDWGQGGGPQVVRQSAVAAFLHDPGSGKPPQIWVEIEFASWFKGFAEVPDADGDGYGELYGRVPQSALVGGGGDKKGDTAAALVAFIRDDYAGKVLSASEVKSWAHQLASYWYPSYNTDLVAADDAWPDGDTEPEIRAELGDQLFKAPTVVMRGKPQGKPVYNVFIVPPGSTTGGDAAATAGNASGTAPSHVLSLPRSLPSPAPAPVLAAIKDELAAHGGSWTRWSGEVTPLRELLRKQLEAIPSGAKATAGSDGFLFFGASLAYVTGGDLEKQRRGRNPIPVIVQFKKLLAAHGVDLLFVPVPTKEEIFPDKIPLSPADRRTAAAYVGKVVNPFERKFLLDLSESGVEVVDLLPPFLSSRKEGRGALLYQAQDTHWTNQGLELAARLVGARVKKFPWYGRVAAHRASYKTKESPFSRHGDLHSRLPEKDKSRYQPESLVGDQVLTAAGALYEDDPDSPIVLLGDSFTGVYQLMDCEHAGVSAHLAKEIGYPVDLVMSYGGGPNVRQKLLRRGGKALDNKRLVIWMMTARDLHDFWEGWQPVPAKWEAGR